MIQRHGWMCVLLVCALVACKEESKASVTVFLGEWGSTDRSGGSIDDTELGGEAAFELSSDTSRGALTLVFVKSPAGSNAHGDLEWRAPASGASMELAGTLNGQALTMGTMVADGDDEDGDLNLDFDLTFGSTPLGGVAVIKGLSGNIVEPDPSSSSYFFSCTLGDVCVEYSFVDQARYDMVRGGCAAPSDFACDRASASTCRHEGDGGEGEFSCTVTTNPASDHDTRCTQTDGSLGC